MIRVLLWIAALVSAVFLLACDGSTTAEAVKPKEIPSNCLRSEKTGSRICVVSLLRLLATPQDFDGARIQTTGYARFALEESALYFDKEGSDNLRADTAIWLSFAPGVSADECGDRDRVSFVEGTFHAGFSGHVGVFGGELTDVTRCRPLPTAE